jgi:hypothetical protein
MVPNNKYSFGQNGDVHDQRGVFYGKVQFIRKNGPNHSDEILRQWRDWLKE